jgi:hypothetical protein
MYGTVVCKKEIQAFSGRNQDLISQEIKKPASD